jgi:tRNA-specific adenosine deaminase 3
MMNGLSASSQASTSSLQVNGTSTYDQMYTVQDNDNVAIGPEAAPLWRITAAMDPNTTPLVLMPVWAVRIDPRKTENYMRFSRSIARRLRAAEQGGDLDGRSTMQPQTNGKNGNHDRRYQSQTDEDEDGDEVEGESDSYEEVESDDEDESMKHLRLFQRVDDGRGLNALICRVQDMPSYERVVALLKTADLVPDGVEPDPFQVRVPRDPAPSRNRLPEWKAFWPVSVKYGKVIHSLIKPNLSGTVPSVSCSTSPGVVDRAADAQMWNNGGIALQWAVDNLQKCLKMAWQAQARGELPIGVHVTSTYPEGDSVCSGVADGLSSIEIQAWDTRRSERNPIKHAVTNAIRDVAKERSERDWERLLVLNAKIALMHKDSNIEPNVARQAVHKAEVAAALAAAQASADSAAQDSSTSSSPVTPNRMSNGQDYLLNNLTLFTTHEPCVSCCMALVHSRVRAIFFISASPRAGGCCGATLEEGRRCAYALDGGPYAVQEQAGLNHKFDVWRWVGDDAILLEGLDADSLELSAGKVHLDILGLDV